MEEQAIAMRKMASAFQNRGVGCAVQVIRAAIKIFVSPLRLFARIIKRISDR
jgi:hypothetical protein